MWLAEYLFCKFRFITSSSMSDMEVISGTPQLPAKRKKYQYYIPNHNNWYILFLFNTYI